MIVSPRNHDSWLAESTMRNGRIRFMRTLQEAGEAPFVIGEIVPPGGAPSRRRCYGTGW